MHTSQAGEYDRFVTMCAASIPVSMSFWNGMPDESRDVAGWMFSQDEDHSLTSAGVHLGLGGKGESGGKLILQVGTSKPVVGVRVLKRWTWHRIQFVRTQEGLGGLFGRSHRA